MVYNVQLLFILLLYTSFSTYFVESSRQRYFERDADDTDEDDCPCGTANYKKTRIMDGKEITDFRKYPWIVSLHEVKEGEILEEGCGGTIISPYYVLTAAHCMIMMMGDNIKIGLKGSDITKPDKYLEVENHIVHPNFEIIDHKATVNDLALLKTKNPIPCSDFNRPICLPKKNIFKVDDELIIVGWGLYYLFEDPNPDREGPVLNEGTIKVLNAQVCKELAEVTKDPPLDEKNEICTIGQPSRVCHGDSGGPLLAERDGRFYLVGVTSYGFRPPCGPKAPQIFVNVARYYSFISKHVKDLPHVIN